MSLIPEHIAILTVMHQSAACDEGSALMYKEMNDCPELTVGRMNDLRANGYVKNTGGSVNKWWITTKAIDALNKKTNEQLPEITHCKTAQLAAALQAANDVITALHAENEQLKQANNNPMNVAGYLLGDTNNGSGLQLYSEDDRLVAFDTLDKIKAIGERSCQESAYDFSVYALVPVGYFKSRTVVDWFQER